MRSNDPSSRPGGAGWSRLDFDSAYARALGPLWAATGPPRLWLDPGPALGNISGVVHGGALATMADIALFVAAGRGTVSASAVTLTLDCAYVAPARIGEPLVATCEVVREGRSIVFAGGRIEAAGEPVLSFSGTLKRLRPRD